MAGLLGLGGIAGIGGAAPPPGLLGPYFDPTQMRNQQIKQGLLGAGIGMLQGGVGSTGQVLGQALAGGLQGANQAGINYRQDAMGYNKLAQEMKDQKEKERQQAAIMQWLDGLPDNQQELARVNPQMAAEAYMKQQFAGSDKGTDDMQEYAAAQRQGFTGTLQDWIVTGKKAGAPQTTIDMKGENAYSVDRNKSFAKRADEIDTGEQAAFKTLNALNQMEKLVQDPSFYSGFGAEQLQSLKSMVVALGGDPNQVSSMEQFNTLSKQAALDTMGGSLGTGFSNADRDFVVGQVPYIGNTPEGNKAVIAINRKMQERKIEIARMARDYEIKNGRLDAGFMQQLSAWAETNPLFTGTEVPTPTQSGTGKTSTGIPWKVLP